MTGFSDTDDFLTQLQAMLARHRLLVVTGDSGSGKSHYCQSLYSAVSRQQEYHAVKLRLQAATGRVGLQRSLAKAAALPAAVTPEDSVAVLCRLADNAPSATLLLLIDDAQYLSPFALKEVLRALDEVAGLSVVLFVDPRVMTEHLAVADLRQASIDMATLAIPPLDDARAAQVADEALAGESLDAGALRDVIRRARGRPGRIQSLVRDARLSQTLGRPLVMPFWRRPVVAWGGGLLLICLLVAGFWLSPFQDAPVVTESISSHAAANDVPEPVPSVAGDDVAMSEEVAARAVVHADNQRLPVTPAARSDHQERTVAPPSSSPAVVPSRRQQPAEVPVSTQKKTAVTPVSAAAPQAPLPLRDERWIEKQPASDYAIQLVSFKTKKEAERYLRRQHLERKAAYLRTRHRGKPLYLVVYGQYPSLSAAKKAAAALPARLRRYQPWVRQFGSLVRLIARARQPLPKPRAKLPAPAPVEPQRTTGVTPSPSSDDGAARSAAGKVVVPPPQDIERVF